MFSDTPLAQRIEWGEALNAAGAGEAIAVGGGYANFAGVGSPLTHAIGMGMNGPVTPADFDRMEDFYRSRGAAVNLDLCPHADWSMFEFLAQRGYRIVECNNVLAGPVIGNPDARLRIAEPNEEDAWNRAVIKGFFPATDVTPEEIDIAHRMFALEGATAWMGIVEGQPVSAGAMNTRGKLALLFADSTLQQYRGQGLHLATIRARLHFAAKLGCDLATASTAPGSASQRNYERAGFRVVYTKLNMQRDWK